MEKIVQQFKTKPFVSVLIVFSVALFLRLYRLETVPNGFHMDEIANTYIGRFILLNGRDLYGNPWPILYFNKFGDYPPVLPMYLSGLATFVFGLNEFAARFPSAVFGALAVFPLYSFVKRLINRKIAFFSILVLSILPWDLELSRASAEGIIALTVFLFGFDFLFKGITHKSNKDIFISWICFGLTYLLYPSFRLLVPLALLPIAFPVLFGRDKKVRRYLFLSFILFTILTGIMTTTVWGRGRFDQTSLFSNKTDAAVIGNSLQVLISDEGPNNALVARIFHNKAIGYGQRIIQQYLSYFSPDFLFIKGGAPDRYNIPHVGLIYLFFLIFAGSAVFGIRSKIKKNVWVYLWYLLLVSSIPAAITVDDSPNLHRAVFMVIPLVVLIGVSLDNFFLLIQTQKKIIKKGILVGLFVFIAVELIYSGHEYFAHGGNSVAYARDDGYKQLALYLNQNHTKYTNVIVPEGDWLPIYYLFYGNDFRPRYIGKFGLNFAIKRIGNIIFVNDDHCVIYPLFTHTIKPSNILLATNNNDCAKTIPYKKVEDIKEKNGSSAFQVFFVPKNSTLK